MKLEYCPSEVALNRRVKHDLDLKVEHDRSTALRLRERMLLVPEEMWENVSWNGAKVKPALNGTWRIPEAGNLVLDHIVLEQQPGAVHNLGFKIDLSHEQDRSLMQAILTRMEVRPPERSPPLLFFFYGAAPKPIVNASPHWEPLG